MDHHLPVSEGILMSLFLVFYASSLALCGRGGFHRTTRARLMFTVLGTRSGESMVLRVRWSYGSTTVWKTGTVLLFFRDHRTRWQRLLMRIAVPVTL